MGSIEEPISATNPAIDLPIINIADSSLNNGKQLVEAAVKHGFLYVSPEGTPFTESLVQAQFELSEQFFAMPTTEKAQYTIGTDNRGWSAMHNEKLDPAKNSKEFKEAFNIGEFMDGRPQQDMPPWMVDGGNLEQLQQWEAACRETCKQILDLIGIGLAVEDGADWFSRRHGQPSGCTMRILHYPALPEGSEDLSEDSIRAGAHSDYGSITLLFQRPSQPGLEIRRDEGSEEWAPVPVFPDNYPSTTFPPILVNIGDLMSYWTDGLLRSTVHRVIFPKDTKAERSRYSLVYFCHPSDDAGLVSVPSPIVRRHREEKGVKAQDDSLHGYGGGVSGSRAMTAKEHLMRRLGATYDTRTHTAKAL